MPKPEKRKTKKGLMSNFGMKTSAEAKLVLENRKITTESVPEDVSRAKASAWLDLVSPLTEWAGLRGDELKSKRQLLRVHTDQTLTEILLEARRKLNLVEQSGRPIPLKFMVPFLEKASVESDDPELKQLWANLLASAFTDFQPEYVHFCSIISQMSPSQAEVLRLLIGTDKLRALENAYDNMWMRLTQISVRDTIKARIDEGEGSKNPDETATSVVSLLNSVGVEVVFGAADFYGGEYVDFDFEYSNYHDDQETDYSILEALGLVRRIETGFFKTDRCDIAVIYYHITQLGIRFAISCGLVN